MISSLRLPRRSRPRRPFQLEPLEVRLAFSVDVGSVLAPGDAPAEFLAPESVESFEISTTDPEPGAILTAPPTALTVSFNRPVDPGTLAFDFQIDELADDGGVIASSFLISDPAGLSPSGDVLTLTPDTPLGLARFRLILLGFSALSDLDGVPLVADGLDRIVAEFSIVEPSRIRFDDATDLGTITDAPTIVAGMLAGDAMQLYRFDLPTGHHWRLGAEVTAERDGGTLDTALTLFDADGRQIATAEVGRADAPKDPYLFAGLGAGTYFVGVSEDGGLGGPYRLHVVADAADEPVTLREFRLDHADPLDTSPTGFRLAFSGPVRVGPDFGLVSPGVELVDGLGRTWPVLVSGYDEAEAALAYVFGSRLPEGRYHLRVPEPSAGGLIDLAGHSPLAHNLPAGVLAAFLIAPEADREDPDDFGPVSPIDFEAGIAREFDIPSGEEHAVRFVIVRPAFTHIIARGIEGETFAELIRLDDETRRPVRVVDEAAFQGEYFNLDAGIYRIHLRSIGPVSARLNLSIRGVPVMNESLLLNGLGQGPALNLRLIAPTVPSIDSPPIASIEPVSPPTPAPTTPSTPSPGIPTSPEPRPFSDRAASNPTDVPAPTTSAPTSDRTVTSEPPKGPAGLLLSLGGEPVGRPLANAARVAAVGPSFGDGVTAVAGGVVGSQPGIDYGFGDASSSPKPTPDVAGTTIAEAPAEVEVPIEESSTEAGGTLLGWLDRLRAAISGIEPSGPEEEVAGELAEAKPGAEPEKTDEFDRAGLTPTAGVIAAAVLLTHLGRGWRRRRSSGRVRQARRSARGRAG